MCSPASRYINQSLVAASRETLRASAKEPFQGKSITLAPNDRGISAVRSPEPVSTTIISPTASRTASGQPRSISSSSLTIMHSESFIPVRGRARPATALARLPSARSIAPTAPRGRACVPRLRTSACSRFWAAWGRVGVEPDGGAEQRLGAAQLGQLVERDAGQLSSTGSDGVRASASSMHLDAVANADTQASACCAGTPAPARPAGTASGRRAADRPSPRARRTAARARACRRRRAPPRRESSCSRRACATRPGRLRCRSPTTGRGRLHRLRSRPC